MERVCRNCRWFYTNESMDYMYLCVNGKSEMLGQFVGDLSDDECDDFERWFLFDDEDEENESLKRICKITSEDIENAKEVGDLINKKIEDKYDKARAADAQKLGQTDPSQD